jgi:hypothetical protein
MSQTLQCPIFDYLEAQMVDLQHIAVFGCFRLVTERPQAAGSNAAASVGVRRSAVASPKAKVLRVRAAGVAPSASDAAGAHRFEAIAKWKTSES